MAVEAVGQLRRKILAVLAVMLTLCACTRSQKETVYLDKIVEVKIPVATIPSIKPLSRPSLEIRKLKADSSSKDIAEAYYNSVKQLVHYAKSLEALLEPFYSKYRKECGNAGK